jgi:hypothetical protein
MGYPFVVSALLNLVLLALLVRPDLVALLRRPLQRRREAQERRRMLLTRLEEELAAFANYYFLWMIAARIAMWTDEPEDLRQAHDMMGTGFEGLGRTLAFLRTSRPEMPGALAGLVEALLDAARVDGLQPTAAIFSQKTEEIRQLIERLKDAIRAERTGHRSPVI